METPADIPGLCTDRYGKGCLVCLAAGAVPAVAMVLITSGSQGQYEMINTKLSKIGSRGTVHNLAADITVFPKLKKFDLWL